MFVRLRDAGWRLQVSLVETRRGNGVRRELRLVSTNMAVLQLAMCYAGLAGITLRGRPPNASIQNISGLPQGLADRSEPA
jgi:hypothetical protein